MRRFRVTLEYDGTHFQGWQHQPQGRSVQGVVEEAIAQITGETVRIHAAGRTDAGVHARGQVAHFDLDLGLRPFELCKALGALLPHDVAPREVREVDAAFDARRDVLAKRYVYRVLNRTAASPLRGGQCWHIRRSLALDDMRQAAADLAGKHDFGAFRGAPGGAPVEEDTRRTLDTLEVRRVGDEVHIEATGRSFLRYMVRNLAGTLVEVGQGRRPAAQMADLLASRDRSRAGPTAPAHGLCLEQIRYRED